jgi:hypothetical protein
MIDCEASSVFYRKEGGETRCRGGEMIDSEWISSMLPFQGEERKGKRPLQKGKGARGATLGSCIEGRSEDEATQRWPTVGVEQHLD